MRADSPPYAFPPAQSARHLHHGLPFDPAYGYDLAALLRVEPPPPPADYADYWRARYARTVAIPPATERQPSPFAGGDWIVEKVFFNSTDGLRIGGWLQRPRHRPVRVGLVISHGYGGRTAPDPAAPLEDAAALYLCARGIHLSRLAGVSEDPQRHVLVGLKERDTYILGGCVEDHWAAASALLELCPEVAGHLGFIGMSFGGGMGAQVLPWDARFRAGHIVVPSFGHHPLRLTMPCLGSGEAVRRYAQHRPEVREVLAYHDAAHAAQFGQQPLLCVNALFDPSVPPPGQFGVSNAWAGPLHLGILTAGHFDGYPGQGHENAHVAGALRQFLRNELY